MKSGRVIELHYDENSAPPLATAVRFGLSPKDLGPLVYRARALQLGSVQRISVKKR